MSGKLYIETRHEKICEPVNLDMSDRQRLFVISPHHNDYMITQLQVGRGLNKDCILLLSLANVSFSRLVLSCLPDGHNI